MKRKICIVLIILLSATFGYAQPKLITREELDKRAVKKLAKSFLKILDESRDFNKIPSYFFADKFENNFTQSQGLDIEDSIINKLNKNEQYDLKVLTFNAEYLSLIYMFSRNEDEYDSEIGLSEFYSPENMFPQEILSMINNTKFLRRANPKKNDNDNDDEEENLKNTPIKSVDELRIFISEMKFLVYAQQIHLNNQSSERVENYSKNIKILRKSANWIGIEKCSGNRCYGYPEKTTIIEYRGYPIYFKVVKTNNTFKVFDIYIQAID